MILFCFAKRSTAYYSASAVAANSAVVGLAPGCPPKRKRDFFSFNCMIDLLLTTWHDIISSYFFPTTTERVAQQKRQFTSETQNGQTPVFLG
jgi:hypothetical protein